MTTPLAPVPGPGGAARAARPAGSQPTVALTWQQLAAVTQGFTPDDDNDLLTWMRGEAIGMAAYAESITEVYETAVQGIGLDPVAMQALHDYADAAAEVAEAMAEARRKFAEHYQEVREFTAGGGVMPYAGRWITGEDR